MKMIHMKKLRLTKKIQLKEEMKKQLTQEN